jgi:excisionase family DNA binding protein
MTLSRYEVLERLSDLLAQESVQMPTTTPAHMPDTVRDLPATSRAVNVETKTCTPSLLLTVHEACAELRVSRAQLYILTNKQRVIEMVHIGKLARIPRASLEAYVDSLRRESSAPRLASEHELCA